MRHSYYDNDADGHGYCGYSKQHSHSAPGHHKRPPDVAGNCAAQQQEYRHHRYTEHLREWRTGKLHGDNDQNGHFTLAAGMLPGTYNWRIKGNKWLANAGSLTFTGAPVNAEFRTQLPGDVNSTHDNIVNTVDFTTLKGYLAQANPVGDLNNDSVSNTVDFTLLKGNFGQGGAAANCPRAGSRTRKTGACPHFVTSNDRRY